MRNILILAIISVFLVAPTIQETDEFYVEIFLGFIEEYAESYIQSTTASQMINEAEGVENSFETAYTDISDGIPCAPLDPTCSKCYDYADALYNAG